MKDKQKNNDTSMIYRIYQELDHSIKLNGFTNPDLCEKSKQMGELLLLKRKEDKGLFRLFLILLTLLVLLSVVVMIMVDKNENLQWYADKFTEFMDVKIDTTNDVPSFFYVIVNGKKQTYNDLRVKNDSLQYLLQECQQDLWKYKTFYELTNRNFDITFRYVEEPIDSCRIARKIELVAAKADSAFMLLPVFRHKLYKANDSIWKIIHN